MNTNLFVQPRLTRNPIHNPDMYWVITSKDDVDHDMYHDITNKLGYPRKFKSEKAAKNAMKKIIQK